LAAVLPMSAFDQESSRHRVGRSEISRIDAAATARRRRHSRTFEAARLGGQRLDQAHLVLGTENTTSRRPS